MNSHAPVCARPSNSIVRQPICGGHSRSMGIVAKKMPRSSPATRQVMRGAPRTWCTPISALNSDAAKRKTVCVRFGHFHTTGLALSLHDGTPGRRRPRDRHFARCRPDELTLNPWPGRALPADEELPLMSACPVAALPSARPPPATPLMALWGAQEAAAGSQTYLAA